MLLNQSKTEKQFEIKNQPAFSLGKYPNKTIKNDFPFLISPSNEYKLHWHVLVIALLLYSCIVIPVQIALYDELSSTCLLFNHLVDFVFLIDMFIIFNSAYYDEDFNLIDDRCKIATTYLKGWFFLDLVSIIPFDLFISQGNEAAHLVRFARIGRITRIVRLFKLARIMRLQKSNQFSVLNWIVELF